MRRYAITYGSLMMLVLCAGGISATDVDRPRDLAARIDRYIRQHLGDGGTAKLQTESGFIRRVTLDLAGRIPTVTELENFRNSESLDKRVELVQRLIDSPDFAFHQRNELDTLMLRRLSHNDQWA